MAGRTKRTLTLGEITSSVVKAADKSGARHSARAVNAWREVVGDEIGHHTRGFARRSGGELVVFVDSAAWANQLALMSHDLQDRINAHLGECAVNSIRFAVSKRVGQERMMEAASADESVYYKPDQVTPVALDDVELAQAAQVAAAAKNEGLQTIALRVMVKDLEQKKGARLEAAEKRRTGGL